MSKTGLQALPKVRRSMKHLSGYATSGEFDELFDQSDQHGGSVLLAIVTGVLQFND